MALYFSKVISDRKSEHPLLKERGVEFRTLAPLKDLNIHGMALEPEIAYGGYATNISAFVTATNLAAKQAVSNETYGFVYSSVQILWTPPKVARVSFAVNRILKDDQRNGIRNRFEDAKIEFANAGQFTKVSLNHPDDDTVQALLPLSADFSRSDPTEIMIKAWHPYRVILLLINNFLATNTYPAFRDKDLSSDETYEYEMTLLAVLRGVEEEDARIVGEGDAVMEGGSDDEEDEAVRKEIWKIRGSSLQEAVLTAKPSPLPSSNNFGPPSSVPNLPGIFFPHFHRMIVCDYVTVPKFLMSKFFKYFGDTYDEARDFCKRIDSAWSSIASTDNGNVISHVIMGIKLSLETQTRLYLVQSGTEYHGFCLLGERFRVFDGSTYVAPVSADELRTTISSHCTDHSNAVHKLAQALSVVTLKTTGIVKGVTVDEITGGLTVMKLVDERNWRDEDKKELAETISRLNFQRSYWGTQHKTILAAVKLMTVDSAFPLSDNDYPSFPGPDITNYGSRSYQVLSMFGPTSFSFIDRQGKGYAIPTMNQEDPLSKVTDGKMEMDTIHVGLKKLSEAHRDWADLLKSGEVMFRAGERASKYRKMVFSGNARNELWTGLRTFVAPLIDSDTTLPPVDVGGNSKKRDQKAADVDDFIASLLAPKKAKK